MKSNVILKGSYFLVVCSLKKKNASGCQLAWVTFTLEESILCSSSVFSVEAKEEYCMTCFFYAPIWLNPTTNTSIPDRPARFLFLALIAKYLDKIFPDPDWPGGIHLKNWYTWHWPGQTSVRPFYVCICC